ncbi:MAG: thiosulfate dehydrogenase (quinone) large subunit [Chloroflexota bacterium]|nr:thiosulfate dehydrogenase (quinone) large subunit [Chloroflexota bacterium]
MQGPPVSPPPSLRDRLRSATSPAAALLPVRFFFGATFLYAGVDKLLDAGFFAATSPTSIQAQMAGFARTSPLGDLVNLALPEAAALGLLIAVAEIGIGLGALTGLAFRVAAAGGALLSVLFFLTVSWSTHPYYLGSDLPYAVGWLTLAIAGHGGLLVPRRLTARVGERARRPDGRRRGTETVSPERRALLQTGLLALAAVAVSSLAVPMRILGLEHGSASAPPGTRGTTGSASPGTTGSAPAPAGLAVARVADVDRSGTASFTIPFDAPAPLPAGDPGIIVRLADGSYVAYDATCTHAGCPVEWSAADAQLVCPCHGAAFDPAHAGAVLIGPAQQPLASLPIVVDPGTGSILLRT